MGGNAIKEFGPATRLTADEYNELMLDVTALISTDKIQALPILSYGAKQNFGDLDILVPREYWNSRSIEEAAVILETDLWVTNNDVTSFAIPYAPNKNFQVDVITVDDDVLHFAYSYFAYNDLGNLIGRVASSVGFKYGHNGLFYRHTVDGKNFTDVLVTRDPNRALTFLGYDYYTFLEGFNTLEEVFKFAVSSPYFSRESFLLENRNHTGRTRDRKRQNYMKFLEWIDRETTTGLYPKSDDEISCRHLKLLRAAFDIFPLFAVRFDAVNDEYLKRQEFKRKFNGHTVNRITGLEREELSKFIEYFKTLMSNDTIMSMPRLELEQCIFEVYKRWKLK